LKQLWKLGRKTRPHGPDLGGPLAQNWARPMLAWQPTAPAALATARALTRDGGAVALAPTALAAAGGKRQAASDTADR
jgi:hypothetical protein